MRAVPPESGTVAVQSVTADDDTLTVKLTSPEGWSRPDLFTDNPTGATLSPPQAEIRGDTLTARFSVSDTQGKTAGCLPVATAFSAGQQWRAEPATHGRYHPVHGAVADIGRGVSGWSCS
ncbi:Uncharacterised protein [Leclercia adecarboxylata]|uniref:Uncharacterized protein n=1 Tax=Leclercia adecarboxylata TaxID=83655 RepID=A0A4U9HVW8_9ENTR|nr:Uncharacterised protein [Leclercia adecarboxylata]